MAIVPLQRFTLYGTVEQKAAVVNRLQELGCTHLINLRGARGEQTDLTSRDARTVLNFLRTSPVKRRPSHRKENYDRHQVSQQSLEIMQRSEDLIQERDRLQRSIAQRIPWGDFAVPPPEMLGGLRLWFYEIGSDGLTSIPKDLQWTIVAEDRNLIRLVVVSADSPKGMASEPLEIAVQSIGELQRQLEQVEEDLDEMFWQRVELTRWRQMLQLDLDLADDEAARDSAAQQLWEDQSLFVIQGWVPESRLDDVKGVAEQHALAWSNASPSESDQPPTLLKNVSPVEGSESCVTFYQMPGYHTWDPTRIIFFSLCIFFAMIVSDAGYGFIMGALFLGFYKPLTKSVFLAPLKNLFLGIVLCTVAYGVLIGSYFGMSPAPDSWLSKFQLTRNEKPIVEDQQLMMLVSVGIGVLHLVIANLMTAWANRRKLRSLGSVGWALMIAGTYSYGISAMLEASTMKQASIGIIGSGAFSILLFSSRLPLATINPLIHLQRIGTGLFQFSSIPKAFGDTLSYLRLFALGLASGQLAMTFNNLARDLSHQSGVGILLALLVLVLGHSINFSLGLMGGLVHGLRLNCIEFLGWSLEEDGYSFQPFRKKAAT